MSGFWESFWNSFSMFARYPKASSSVICAEEEEEDDDSIWDIAFSGWWVEDVTGGRLGTLPAATEPNESINPVFKNQNRRNALSKCSRELQQRKINR